MNSPILSIVIANYNYGRFLEEAILSVLRQADSAVELIVVDGGSTDNSVEIIRKYAGEKVVVGVSPERSELRSRRYAGCRSRTAEGQKISYWVSEPDKGQSDAFNKGFAKARGKYLTWLNADDVLVPGALAAVVRELTAYPECEWFTGNFYRFIDETGRISEVGWGPHIYPKWMQRRNSPIVSFGPSTIFAKSLWERIGRIDESIHLMMDTDLWMRFIVAGVKQRRIAKFIWAFRMHEDSKTAEFGAHKLDNARAQKFNEERRRSVARTGYKVSPFWRFAVIALRLADGSLLRRWYLMQTMKRHQIATGGV